MSAARFSRLCLLMGLAAALASWGWLDGTVDGSAEAAADAGRAGEEKIAALEEEVTQGALRVAKDDGTVVECPLRHTDVQADVSGFIARVKVTQTFYNPTSERIEAVYVFPLPHEAAVDDMTMVIGERKIVGLIKRRAEARQIYQEALAAGQTAALLEQERPNIFTQSVGNIDPGQEVRIEISYVDVLGYDMGTYAFHFPMVVGPRFIPGAPVSSPQPVPAELQGKVSPPAPDTTRVPDASRITPPVLKPGHRNGHDVSLALRLDAGVLIQDLKVVNHQAEISRQGDRRAEVKLSPADSIPNKDFVLRYHVVGKKPEMALLAHTGNAADAQRLGRGYFLLMIQPKEDERLTKSPPREIVFLLDVSGSMSGEPTEKVKEAMREMLKLCREIDTVQVITFASQTQQLFEKPVPVNNQNIARALNFTRGIQGGGGTHMLEGVKRAIDQPKDADRVRIVIMLTDGYIGNEAEIIEHVGKHCGDQIRFWAIGIGSSPNMFLVDGVARQGGGMGKKLELRESAAGLAEEVVSRIQRAQLAKIQIDWGGLDVAETYPAKIPELWAGRPVILFGRYAGEGAAEIKVNGVVEGEPVSWPLRVALPGEQPSHDVLAKVWARKKIESLMHETFYQGSPAVEEEVTAIALDYRLMSQYTSFVAVDAKDAQRIAKERPAQPPRRMLVPVPLPEGTRWEGFFGPTGEEPADEVRQLTSSLEVKRKFSKEESLARSRWSARFGGRGPASASHASGGLGGGAMGAMPGAPMPMMPAMKPASPAPARSGLALGRPMQQSGQLGRADRGSPVAGTYGYSNFNRRQGQVNGLNFSADGRMLQRQAAAELKDFDQASAVPGWYFAQTLGDDSGPLAQAAQQALDAGRKQREKKALDEAQGDLVRAYFFASAAANRGDYAAAQAAQQALAELESLHVQQVEAWTKQSDALSKKLDLVLRDLSIGEALAAVGKAAGLEVQLLKGSDEDAAEILAGRETRVRYIDLRGATAAQALDWMLQPLRLTWEPDRGAPAKILAGSDRRMPGAAAWVYDVSTIALPLAKELKQDDQAKAAAEAKEDAQQFLRTVRRAAQVSDQDMVWFAPGQLLVLGPPAMHARVADVLAKLSQPQPLQDPALAVLHGKTVARAKDRHEQLQKLEDLDRLAHTAAVHDEQSWRLLAAALGGQLDLEALTELQIAWKADATRKLLEGAGAAVALRSAWAVTAASQRLPNEKELTALAELVRRQCRSAGERAVAALAKKPQEISAVLAAVYGAMAAGDVDLTAKVLGALPQESTVDPTTGAVILAARSLLGKSGGITTEQLGKLVAQDAIVGEDATVLVALACRKSGRETWNAFRGQTRDLLGDQPLPGTVVVLVHRLSGR